VVLLLCGLVAPKPRRNSGEDDVTTKVWLDTDIGSDVDDAVALALGLLLPEIELVGVSTVYGDVALRARMVRKLTFLAGRSIPVFAGCERPLLGERPVFWGGWEGEGLLQPEDRTLEPEPVHAVDAMIKASLEHEGELVICCIGPMTNLAVALVREPQLAQRVRSVVIMGGVSRCGDDGLKEVFAEHNVACDPEAAAIVFRCSVPSVMVGLDVTRKVVITAEQVKMVRQCGDDLRLALADQLERYLKIVGRDFTYMHDPLAMAHIARPEFLSLLPCEVLVETKSEIAPGATWVKYSEASNTQVAVGVDSEAFQSFLVQTLTSQ